MYRGIYGGGVKMYHPDFPNLAPIFSLLLHAEDEQITANDKGRGGKTINQRTQSRHLVTDIVYSSCRR